VNTATQPFNDTVEGAGGGIFLHVNKLSSGMVDVITEQLQYQMSNKKRKYFEKIKQHQ
jgi:hypothetical protein